MRTRMEQVPEGENVRGWYSENRMPVALSYSKRSVGEARDDWDKGRSLTRV